MNETLASKKIKSEATTILSLYMYILATFQSVARLHIDKKALYPTGESFRLNGYDLSFFERFISIFSLNDVVNISLMINSKPIEFFRVFDMFFHIELGEKNIENKLPPTSLEFLSFIYNADSTLQKKASLFYTVFTREFGLKARLNRFLLENSLEEVNFVNPSKIAFPADPWDAVYTMNRVIWFYKLQTGDEHLRQNESWSFGKACELADYHGIPKLEIDAIRQHHIYANSMTISRLYENVKVFNKEISLLQQSGTQSQNAIKDVGIRIDSLVDEVAEINKLVISSREDFKEKEHHLKALVKKIEEALGNLPDQIFSAVEAIQRTGKRARRLAFQVFSDGKIYLHKPKTIKSRILEIQEASLYPSNHAELDFVNLVADIDANSTSFNIKKDTNGPQKLTNGKAEWSWTIHCLPHAMGTGIVNFSVWEIDGNGHKEKVHEESIQLEIIATKLEKLNQIFINGRKRYFAFAIAIIPIAAALASLYF